MNTYNKKLIALFLILLTLNGLVVLALYQYDMSQNKAVSQVPALQKQVGALKAVNKAQTTQNGLLVAQNTQLGNQKAHFCEALSKAKIVDPLCVQ